MQAQFLKNYYIALFLFLYLHRHTHIRIIISSDPLENRLYTPCPFILVP